MFHDLFVAQSGDAIAGLILSFTWNWRDRQVKC